MTTSKEHWYIDAIDARAGICFAANRRADLDDKWPNLDLPCAFIEPPSFRPVHIHHRAVSFAATRRSFQLGFYLNGKEVEFASLEGVIEFTRRCYLRGGGTEGTSPEGTPLPPAPLPQGGDDQHVHDANNQQPEVPQEGTADTDLKREIERFQRRILPPRGTTEEIRFTWSLLPTTPPPPTNVPGAFAPCFELGARLLWDELLRRRDPAKNDVWWLSLSYFCMACELIGMRTWFWRTLTDHPALGADPAFSEELCRTWRRLGDWPVGWHRAADPSDSLQLLPVPSTVARATLGVSRNTFSLYDFLCAFVASPQEASPASMQLAWFAAAVMVAPSTAWSRHPHDERRSERVGEEAARWLSRQLPQFVFNAAVENEIRLVANASTHGAPTPATPSPARESTRSSGASTPAPVQEAIQRALRGTAT